MLGTDIYEMFTAALRRLVESACLKLPFYEVAGTINFTAECVRFLCARLPKAKRISKAGSVRDTSTKFFVVWKTSAGIFPRMTIQNPKRGLLSSAAMVTAAETVQSAGFATM